LADFTGSRNLFVDDADGTSGRDSGLEYMHGLRRNYDGSDGTANRLQAMLKFIF
jgi:hypothetical protein